MGKRNTATDTAMFVSPYLQRPLRTYKAYLRDLGDTRPLDGRLEPSPPESRRHRWDRDDHDLDGAMKMAACDE